MSNNEMFEIEAKTGEIHFVNLPRGTIYAHEDVPADHPVRQAMDVGQKVMGLAPEGSELHSIEEVLICCWPGIRVNVLFLPPKPVPPPEPVGVEWLKSLPVGTRRCNSDKVNPGKFVIMKDGLHWAHCKSIWKWDGTQGNQYQSTWHNVPWVLQASPETCPEWLPEKNTDG